MSVQLGINGFGRIGRLLFRAAIANPQKFRITAINDLNDIPYLIYLLKYDTAHGKFLAKLHNLMLTAMLMSLNALITLKARHHIS